MLSVELTIQFDMKKRKSWLLGKKNTPEESVLVFSCWIILIYGNK